MNPLKTLIYVVIIPVVFAASFAFLAKTYDIIPDSWENGVSISVNKGQSDSLGNAALTGPNFFSLKGGNAVGLTNAAQDFFVGGAASSSAKFVVDAGLNLTTVTNLTITGTCTGCSGAAGRPASNSIDWDEFVNSSTLDGAFTIASAGNSWNFGTTDVTINLARIGTPASSTLQGFYDMIPSPGMYTGGVITDAGGGSITVSAGTGGLRSANTDTSSQYFISWLASGSFAIPSNTTRYIGVKYNSGSPKVTMLTTDTWDYDTQFPLGVVINEAGTLKIVAIPWWTGDSTANIIERFDSLAYVSRDNRTGGLIISSSGTRNLSVTSGALLGRLSEFNISALDTSVAGSFDTYYRDGSGGFTKGTGVTQWNNTQYDNNSGTLQSLTVLNFVSNWFYLMTDGSVAMVYGQAQYSTLAGALNDGVPSSVPNRISKGGMLIGRIIAQQGSNTAQSTQSAFGTAFTSATVTNHSDLANLAWTSSGHTGTASTLAGFNSSGTASESLEAKYTYINGTRAFTGNISHGGFNISSVGNLSANKASLTIGFEDLGTASISGKFNLWNSASISVNLEAQGYASASQLFVGQNRQVQFGATQASLSIPFEVGGYASIGGNLFELGTGSSSFAGSLNTTKSITSLKTVTAAGFNTTGQFFSGGVGSNSFSGSLNTTLGLHATTDVSAGGLFLGIGAGSNSFVGSLNIAKGIKGNSFQGGGLVECLSGKLTWTAGQFGCGIDASGTGLRTEDDSVLVQAAATQINFGGTSFSLTASGTTETIVKLDWTLGPASRGMTTTQTWSGKNVFSAGASVSGGTGLEITGNASVSGNFRIGGNEFLMTNASIAGNFELTGVGSKLTVGALTQNDIPVGLEVVGVASISQWLNIGQYPRLANSIAQLATTSNNFAQLNIQNFSSGASASTDLSLTSNDGNNSGRYVNLGINSATFKWLNQNTLTNPHDAYLIASVSNLDIWVASGSSTASIKFAVGNTPNASNQRFIILSTGASFSAGTNVEFGGYASISNSATSFLKVPYNTFSLTASGQVIVNSASKSLEFRSGDAQGTKVIHDTCFTFIVDSPTTANPGFVGPKMFDDPFTITSVGVVASGQNSATFNLQYGAPNTFSTAVFTNGKKASTASNPIYTSTNYLVNTTISDGQGLEVKLSSRSATLQSFSVNVCGRYTH